MATGFGSMTDGELLAEIRQTQPRSAAERSPSMHVRPADDAALGELLRRHYAWLSRVCLVELYDASVALDCLQETLLEIAKAISSFDGRSELRTWMFTIARRTVARYRKRDIRRQERFPLGREDDISRQERAGRDVGKDTEQLLLENEQHRRLLLLVRQLPEKQRHAVLFHYFEDLSVEQTAERLACSVGTVKTHLFRGREKLKELLEDEQKKEDALGTKIDIE
ncbi:MAG: RNA polymerase sigma factor [Bdellovibrionota bacterium]